MTPARPLLEQLSAETEAMVGETEALVAIDSGTGDTAGIRRVSTAVGELLTPLGFTLKEPETGRAAGGLEATLALGDGPKLLILGHADTVWPAGTAAEWPSRQADGMLSGPGAGDMKGCVVMAVHAVAAALAHAPEGIGSIELLLVPDEEAGSVASRAWIEARARTAGACLCLEAGWPGGGVVVARGAVGALQIHAHGRTAHCAGHEGRGASAVAALAPLVSALESLSRPADGVLVSVGRFHGGTARQVVPGEAELELDLRAPDPSSAERLLRDVRRLVTHADAAHPEVTITHTGDITRPPFPPAASETLYATARTRADELGIPLTPAHSRGGADSSFAAALGVPTLDGLGPICHDSCSRTERIEVASLAQRGALLAAIILDLAAQWRSP